MIAASAGNHAQAVAYHGRRLGIPVDHRHAEPDPDDEGDPDRRPWRATSCFTASGSTTPMPRRGRSRPRTGWSSSIRSTIRRSSPAPAPSALEMLEDAPDLDMLVVPIGGGGLICGHRRPPPRRSSPGIEVIGVEAELYPSMKNVVEGGHGAIGGDTLAEGIAVKEPGELTRAIIKANWSTDRPGRRSATSSMPSRCWSGSRRRVVEGAGAAGLAAILADPDRFKGRKVGTILCGGNIDTHLLANVLVRELVRCGRIARLKHRRAGPARRARRDHRQIPRMRGQHHRDQPPPHLHPPAGQGHGDRGRMRGTRRRGDRPLGRARSKTAGFMVERAAARLNRPIRPFPGQARSLTLFSWAQPLFIRVYRSHKDFVTIDWRPARVSAPFRFPKFFVTNPSPARTCRARSSGRCSRSLTAATPRS